MHLLGPNHGFVLVLLSVDRCGLVGNEGETDMTVIVKGHGSRLDDGKTFVPVGTKVRFYSGFDVDISQNVELVAIASGAKATAQEAVDGSGKKDDVANYELGTVDDEFVARWLAIGGASGIPIYFVGVSEIKDGARLCESPDTCEGTHSCTGVLGTLKAEKDIVILACRGYVDDDEDEPELRYGTDAKNPLHAIEDDTDAYVNGLLALAKSDPAAAEKQVDQLPQGTIAFLVNRWDYRSWQEARHLKDLALARDWEQILGHLKANPDDRDAIMKWLVDIPSYGAALDQAVIASMVSFAEEYNTAPSDEVLNVLLTRPAVKVALQSLRSDWQPNDTVLKTVTDLNAANVKALPDGNTATIIAGGLLVLLGAGHGDDETAYVGRQQDFEQGTFTVTKGGAFNPGSLDVAGISAKRAVVEQAVGAISKKKVNFS